VSTAFAPTDVLVQPPPVTPLLSVFDLAKRYRLPRE